MKLEWSVAAEHAVEAAASLSAFHRLGYKSIESLDRREQNLSGDQRLEVISNHQLGLSAMSFAIREVARDERDEHRKRVLSASADLLDVFHELDWLKAERQVGFGSR